MTKIREFFKVQTDYSTRTYWRRLAAQLVKLLYPVRFMLGIQSVCVYLLIPQPQFFHQTGLFFGNEWPDSKYSLAQPFKSAFVKAQQIFNGNRFAIKLGKRNFEFDKRISLSPDLGDGQANGSGNHTAKPSENGFFQQFVQFVILLPCLLLGAWLGATVFSYFIEKRRTKRMFPHR
jgi:hypothetical protein